MGWKHRIVSTPATICAVEETMKLTWEKTDEAGELVSSVRLFCVTAVRDGFERNIFNFNNFS